MSLSSRQKFALALLTLLACGFGWFTIHARPAYAQAALAQAATRYAVVDSDGTNLIVTDNQTNTLYFYAVDKDAHVGSDLKLRGSFDLKEVGKPVLKPKVEMQP